MSKLSIGLRYAACIMWIISGIAAGGLIGYGSALASFMFLLAMRLDMIGFEGFSDIK